MQIHQMDILDHPNTPGSLGQVFGTAPSFQQMEAGYGLSIARWSVKSRVRRLEFDASFDMGFPWFSVLRPLDTFDACCRKHSYQKGSHVVPWIPGLFCFGTSGRSQCDVPHPSHTGYRAYQSVACGTLARTWIGRNATNHHWTIGLESWEGVAASIWTLSICRSIDMTDVTCESWRLVFFLMARAFSEAICIHAPPLSLDNWSFSGRLVAWNAGMKHHCLKSSIALSLGSVRFFCMNDLGFGQCDAPTLGSGVGVTALSAGYGHSCILDTQGAVLGHLLQDRSVHKQPQCLPWIVPMAKQAFHHTVLPK